MSTAALDLSQLIIEGQNAAHSYADVLEALTSLTMRETITGASTIDMSLVDPHRTILRSVLLQAGSNVADTATAGVLSSPYGLRGATVVLDGAGFELVAVKKSGSQLNLTFEDMAVAELRRRTGQRVVAANTMSRAAFCASLIREVPWIKVAMAPGAKSLVQLARGTTTSTTAIPGDIPAAITAPGSGTTTDNSVLIDGERHIPGAANNVVPVSGIISDGESHRAGSTFTASADAASATVAASTSALTATTLTAAQKKAELEDTWTACGRIMGEIGWRVMARRGGIVLAPDTWLMTHAAGTYTLGETSQGVDLIDVDWDVGKPAATATITCWAGATELAAGSTVNLKDMGPANGPWLVETIQRTVASKVCTVTLLRPQPSLQEPVDTSTDGSGLVGDGGYGGAIAVSGLTLQQIGSENSGPGSIGAGFIRAALSARGKPYVAGASGPNSFDCSGLVSWAAAQVGVSFPEPVSAQSLAIVNAGMHLSVQDVIATAGAVLYRGVPGVNGGMSGTDHIAISLGNGQTMEARGRAYGCNVFSATKGRDWAGGGLIPGIGRA